MTDREVLRELSSVWRGGGHIANAAAAIAVVIPDEDGASRARAQSLRHRPSDDADDDHRRRSGHRQRSFGRWRSGPSEVGPRVPEDKLVAFVIDLGYPADRPLRPGTGLKRRPFDEVVHRNGW